MSESDLDQAIVDVLDEITDRLRANQSVDIEAYAARYPDAAERIRRLVPALQVMEALQSEPDGERQDDGLTGTLGDYRILREVGRGGMGVVYEAEQISLGRRVALKVLPFAATADARQLKRFHNEARAAASLEHPGVVPVYGVGCERSVHYYAMRFIDGRTLAELIESRRGRAIPNPTTPYTPGEPAPPSADTAAAKTTERVPRDPAYFRQVAEWVAQAAEALEHAHQLGVIHRDVKPHNLMIDGEGKLWVTDFGLARLAEADGLTMSGDLLGTLRYMAPEQALARTGIVDHRADVYGLGATLYELLTLEHAVRGEDRKEVLYRIAFEEPASPRKLSRAVPRDLETVALKAVEKSPGDRYVTAGEMAADLRRFLQDRPIAARPPTWWQRAARWRRKHPATTAAVVASLIVAATVLAVSLGWTAGERRARRMETERVVEAALSEAADWLRKDRPYEAQSAALRAEGFVRQAGGHPGLQAQVDEILWDIRLLLRLELACLASSSAVTDVHYDAAASDEDYEKAFLEFGLDVLAMNPGDVARRLQDRLIRPELVGFLGDWAFRRRAADLVRRREDGGWRRILEVIRQLDTDGRTYAVLDKLVSGETTKWGRGESGLDLGNVPSRLLPYAVYETPARTGSVPDSIIEHLRTAQRLSPTNFWVNDALGLALSKIPNHVEEAVGYYRVALALRPESPGAMLRLGHCLMKQKRHDEAIIWYKEAIRRKSDYAAALNGLANALARKGKSDEAIVHLKDAIRLNPGYAEAHCNLGTALTEKGRVEEAIPCLREAVRLRPDFYLTHNNLGAALQKQGRVEEAIACYREAVRLKPEFAEAHFNLGFALEKQGYFEASLSALRRAHELRSKRRNWPSPTAEWVREAERLVELDGKLLTVLTGKARPVNAAEAAALASLCLQYKRKPAAAAHLFADAFEADPTLAQRPDSHRYNAACAAALAASGNGTDAAALRPAERLALRRQALTWLAADFNTWRRLLANDPDGVRPAAVKTLKHWLADPDLASVHGPAALAKLPSAERQAWQRLWADVADLLARSEK